jgi:hypothetical protein
MSSLQYMDRVLNDDEVPFDADVNYRVPLGREACRPL